MQEQELDKNRELFEDNAQPEEGEHNHGEDGEPLEEFVEGVQLFHGFSFIQDDIFISVYFFLYIGWWESFVEKQSFSRVLSERVELHLVVLLHKVSVWKSDDGVGQVSLSFADFRVDAVPHTVVDPQSGIDKSPVDGEEVLDVAPVTDSVLKYCEGE